MKLGDLIRGTAIQLVTGKRLFGLGKDEENSQVLKMGGDQKTRAQLDSYRGVVYACISAISEEVARYQPLLTKPKGDGMIEVKQHELITLLNNPQPNEVNGITKYELFEATQSFIELTGECFWYKVLGETTRKPKAIYILRPDRMGVDIDDQGNINGYFLRRNSGTPIPFDVDEIEHFKMFNPKNPYRGLGTIEAGQDYIASEDFSAQFTKNFFKNNAGISGILSVNGEVSKNAFKKFVNQWREKYEGVDAAGKVAILRETDATFEKVGLGLDELDMTALRKMSIDEVLMMFRVPRSIIGLSDESGLGRASVETLEYIFNKRVIDPKMTRIDSVVQRMASRHWAKDGLTISHENIVPSDKEFELKVRETAVDIWLSRNEIREEDGLDPKDGADDLRANLSTIGLSEDLSGDSSKSASKKLVLKLGEPKKKDSDEVETTKAEQFRLRLMRNQKSYERKFDKAIQPVIDEQQAEVLNNLEALGGTEAGLTSTKDLEQFLFNLKEAVKKFGKVIVPVLLNTYETQGKVALEYAGSDEDFKVDDRVSRHIADSTARMAKNYNEESLAILSQSLSEGVNAGESLGKLKKRVEAVYKDTKGYRAERIARTETLKASNQATNFAYKQTGYVKEKKWFTNPNACEFCRAFNGKTVGLDDNFASKGETVEGDEGGTRTVDYEDVVNPPVHPNCRCTIIPVR